MLKTILNAGFRLIRFFLCSVAVISPVTAAEENYQPPLTPWGDPDIQGIYNTATITPFERPDEFAGREFLTAEEAAERETRSAERRVDAPPREGDTGTYNQFWFEPGTKWVSTLRTSLIIDPPDGKFPALTESAQATLARWREEGRRHTDGPEGRPLAERCLWWASTGPPIIPTGYNNNYRIVQSPDHVLLLNEMIHDARIIPLDGREPIPENITQWLGDSRGHWEGNTLVVETTHFNDITKKGFGRPPFGSVRGISDNARLIERFTPAADDILLYEFTVDDPETYVRPWTAQVSWRGTEGPVYEYACHEGNYGLRNVLSGARRQDGE